MFDFVFIILETSRNRKIKYANNYPYYSNMAYSDEIKHEAKILYLRKMTPTEIHERLKVPKRTVYDWIKNGNWEALVSYESVEEGLARRINILAFRENKTDAEIRELKTASAALLEFRKVELAETKLKLLAQGGSKNIGSNADGSKRKRKEKKVKNDISHLTIDDFKKHFHSKLFWHQKLLYKNRNQRNREVSKPRQGGYTWYFAGEAFERAVIKGDDSIFLSASRNQAEIFLAYIRAMASVWFDIELTGNPIVLSNGATLRPVSTNGRTAQGYSGHVYWDEYSWTPKFKDLYKLALAMATQKGYTRTLFSTPSSKQHEAYSQWTSKTWKKEHPRNKKQWPTEDQLKEGFVCPDGRWRFACTIEDLVNGGFNLVSIEDIKEENSKEDYLNLYMLQWIDGQSSAFSVSLLERCLVDSGRRWKDINHDHARPYGNGLVRIGYDPSRTKDNACVVVVAEPTANIDKHRILEKLTWNNVSWEYQRDEIEKLTKKYNVSFLGMDVTGIGSGVYELIQKIDGFSKHKIFPIKYSPQIKTDLVLRSLNIIKNKRLQYDQDNTSISAAFLTVKKQVTNGGVITYASNRTAETGHADEAWAVMHALSGEPINYQDKQTSTWS
ncbi:terminase large subunit domain-containing protein [Pseudomonas sp. HK3]